MTQVLDSPMSPDELVLTNYHICSKSGKSVPHQDTDYKRAETKAAGRSQPKRRDWAVTLCLIFSLSPSGPNIKSKESKRKEDLSIKPRSPMGTNPVTSSRFTVSPANDPHLVWLLNVIMGTFRAEPSWTGQRINPNNQPFTQRLFFYWIGNWKNETPVLKAGHIPGFTSDSVLYDRGCCAPACHYLQSLFIAFGYKSLWERQHMLGEEEPGAL